jgi:hypothetical protein
VRSSIDELRKKGVSVPPSVDAALLTANTAIGRWPSQSSLRPLAKARNVSLITPLARSTLALVFLWYAKPTIRHEPMPLAKAWNTALVNLESWSTTSTSGKPSPDRRHMSRLGMISAASAAVAVARVGTACTLPESRSTWFWIMSNPAAVVGSPAIQSTPIIPAGAGGGEAPVGRNAPP